MEQESDIVLPATNLRDYISLKMSYIALGIIPVLDYYSPPNMV
jgi:hypothetical protein